MATDFETYERLRKHIPEEAARVIAERLPPTAELATRSDIESQVERLSAEFRGELHRVEAAIYRWMLTFFATLWLGMAGMIVAIVLG